MLKLMVLKQMFAKDYFWLFFKLKKRLEILQRNIVTKQSLDDERGHHANHYQITDEIWRLLGVFINKIPKKNSH